MSKIGLRIKQLRKDMNLSQIDLAKKLNISNTTLSQYETGQRIPSDDIKIQLANFFDCTTDYLLGLSENKKTPADFTDNEVYIMFRIRLKELREENKISQQKLADTLGVKQSTVGMWENGKNKPEFDTLIKISEYFDVSVDYLLGKTNKKMPADLAANERDLETAKLLSRLSASEAERVRDFVAGLIAAREDDHVQ